MAKKIYEQENKEVSVSVHCISCKTQCLVDMTFDQFRRLDMFLKGRGHAQDLLADIPDKVREIFISGICPDCWSAMFDVEEKEDEVYV